MKSSVNKLMIMVWTLCLASFVFADQVKSEDDILRYQEIKDSILGSFEELPEDSQIENDLRCDDSSVTFYLFDSYGDGWDSNSLTFNGDVLSYTTGSLETFTYCLPLGDYSASFTAGSWSSECSWQVVQDGTYLIGNFSNQDGTFTVSNFGCTDATACNYDSNATADDQSCTYAATNYDCDGNCVAAVDSCGICGGADASTDCADTCSGTLDQGTFSLSISYADGDTQNEVYSLSASGSNWSVANCSNYTGEGSASGSVSFSADCDLTTDFWVGPVSLSLAVADASTNIGSINISGNGLNVTLDGAFDDANSTGSTLVGDTSAASVGGAMADNCGTCDMDDSNDCVQDCNDVWGGLSQLDTCGDCWSPYCYNMTTHIPDYGSNQADCESAGLMWVGSGGSPMDPTWNAADLGCGCDLAAPSGCDSTCGSTLENDVCGVCDGDGSSCVQGCMDSTACNYNPDAVIATDCYTIDSCGVCGGADASFDCNGDCFGSFGDGTFGLAPNDDMTDWTLQAATADESSDGWWSVGNCSNFVLAGGGVAGGADEGPLSFTADCSITSASFNGDISLTLGVSDVADDGSATGSITLSAADFSAVATGSVTDSTTFPTLAGSVDAFSVLASPNLDGDALCDDVDPDVDGDGIEPGANGTGDCDDTDASVGLCTYASCDEWGGTGCLWADGTVYEWSEGWWQCEPWNGNDVCGLAEVNFEVDTNGSADAAGNTLVGMFGPYNGWNPNFDIYSDADGDGVHTLTLYLGVGDLEYKLFGNADASAQENLIDLGTTVQGYQDSGDPYYEYLNASCAPVTDYWSYANRLISITAADINTSQTVSTCYGSCNATCLTGCTDATSCNYSADDALNIDLSGQVNYDSDDGSCLQTDTCGFCGGLDANLDCAGDCSGDLASGSLTEDAGVSLVGAADNGSWTLDGCTVASSSVVDNSFLQTVSTVYDCDFTSNVFVGSVSVSSEQNIIANTNTPTTALFNVVVDGGVNFGFSTAVAISSFDAAGIVGELTFSDTFGLVGTGVDGFGTDCNQECGGSAAVDDCGICAGGGTSEVTNEDNLGCGCFNDAALSYFEDADGDGLGANGTDSVLFCLPTDDCANVDGGCSSATVPHTVVPGQPAGSDSCADSDNGATDYYGDTCSGYTNYPSWCGGYDDADFDSASMCCACGGGTITPGTPATPDTYDFGWVLNDTDADDLCTSNAYDCNNVCDGPGVINTLGDGACCNSGAIDCTNTCDGALVGTNFDGLGTDCNGECGGAAQVLDFGWTSGSYDSETSWSVVDGSGTAVYSDADGMGYPDYAMPSNGCFLANEDYTVLICDTFGDGWNGASLTIDDESYTHYEHITVSECLTAGFSLDGDGGCSNADASNYSDTADWDNGSCEFTATAPTLTVTGQDDPADYPGEIGYDIDWTEVPYAESYALAWYDSSEAPVLGDSCLTSYGSYGTIGCDGSTCVPNSYLGGSFCSSGFDCVEFDYDDEACCAINGLEQSTDSDAVCYVAPPPTCTASEWEVILSDSYGDGWSGQQLTIGDQSYSLDSGASTVVCYGGPMTDIVVECSSGSWNSEISWAIVDSSGTTVLSGGAPYSGCIGDCGPSDPAYTVMAGGGSWASEISWSVVDAGGSSVCAGYSGTTTCALADGTYTFAMADSYGDGWGSNAASMIDASGNTVFSGFTVASGYSASATFAVPYSASTASIVDVTPYDNTVYIEDINQAKELVESYSNYSSKDEHVLYISALNKLEQITNLYDMQVQRAITTLPVIEINPNDITREPIGWVVVLTTAGTGAWWGGFDYGFDREFAVATSTNMGQGDWSTSVVATTPVLPVPADFVAQAGPQIVDDYEFANLSWTYPTFAPTPFPDCNGTLSYIGDGDCDTYNNNPECGWDGGDCCEDTCEVPCDDPQNTTDTCYDCQTDTEDVDSDGCWDVCYDPATACGEGIPTCNDDYQFGVIVAECTNYSNAISLFWNAGCTAEIHLNGSYWYSTSSFAGGEVTVTGVTPGAEYLFELVVDGTVVASESEFASDENCDEAVENCTGSLSYIGDGDCDSSNNNSDCLWDGGDCCPSDCVPAAYSCYDSSCSTCLNPDSADNVVDGPCDLELGDDCVYYGSAGTVGCDGSTCTPNSYLGGSFCSSGFDCVEFDYDDEACCASNGLEQSTDPSALCYVAPPPTCTASEWEVTLLDSYGDGWSGQQLTVGDQSYTLDSGSSTYFCYGGPMMDIEVECSSGSWNSEISWAIVDSSGTPVLSGGAPYSGCIGDCGPSDPAYTVTAGGGSWASEISWAVLDNAGSSVCAGYSGTTTCELADGTYTFAMADSYGDGWGSNAASMIDASGNTVFSGFTVASGYSGSETFAVPYSASTASIVDITPYVESEEYASAKLNEYIELIAAADFGSKEWYALNKDMPGSLENPMIHESGVSMEDKTYSDDFSEMYGYVTEYNQKVGVNGSPNADNYRAALGFNVWKEASDGSWTNIGSTTTGTTFQVTADPIGCYAVSAYDTDPVYETALSTVDCVLTPACPITGDVTQDGLINVSDIVYLVNSILGSGLDAGCADMNDDGSINVSDVVALVNVILNPRTASANDASEAVLLISENTLKLESDGFIQGVQMTLSHDSGFEIELSDAYVSDYKTVDNQTTLMIVTDGSHSINDIATFDGDVVVESVHVVNQSGDVTVEETVEIANFEVKVTGPNPFNPSTQLNIVVPEAGFVSVNVYNILGQKVATLVDGYMDANSAGHMVNFNASHLASGVYLVRAVTANDVATQKLMLLK